MRRTICLILGGLLVASEIALPIAHAQSTGASARRAATPDTEPPIIELEALAETTVAQSQVFTAQVVDDRTLLDVTLHHRRRGELPFVPVLMRPVGDSVIYSVTLPTETDDMRPIEYYVQARDEGGNRTVNGYAFDPYVRSLVPSLAANAHLEGHTGVVRGADARVAARSASAPVSIPTGSPGPVTERRIEWWQVALGVVAVGALAAAAGGGGSGGSVASDDGTVPFTLNLGEPAR